jgi:myo-inositol-1(or 4)-monophosphatase
MSHETSYDELRDKAVGAARAGAAVLLGYFEASASMDDGFLGIEDKGKYDYVSKADRESEAAILAEIRRHFPEHHVLAEESGLSATGSGDYQWLVDPLDGTTNFLQGLPVFCISVACRKGDEVVAGAVLDPVTDQLFTAAAGAGARHNGRPMRASDRDGLEGAFLATGYPWRARAALSQYLGAFHDLFLKARSIRRCGAAALDLAWTAAGVYDGFFEFRLSPWDIAAGVLLVREAGGRITDLDGREGFPEGGNVLAGGARVQPPLLELVRRHADEATLDRLVPRNGDPARTADRGSLTGVGGGVR